MLSIRSLDGTIEETAATTLAVLQDRGTELLGHFAVLAEGMLRIELGDDPHARSIGQSR